MTITYNDTQIVAMSDSDVAKLGMLCPKKVYFQMDTSGSPSVWTNNGEVLHGFTGSSIVSAARIIRLKHRECEEIEDWNYSAHIRVVF